MDSEKKNKKKQIAILGSTGSIGTQALQVIEEHPDLYEAYALTANNRVELLIAQARKFQPEVVVIANEEKYAQLKEALSDLPIKVYAGIDAVCQIVEAGPVDMVLTAMISGLSALKWPCKVDLFINSFAIMNAVSSNGGKPIGATALWNQLAEAQAKHAVAVHLTDGYDAAVVERCRAAAREKSQELVFKAS